jgi:hypothetical protein
MRLIAAALSLLLLFPAVPAASADCAPIIVPTLSADPDYAKFRDAFAKRFATWPDRPTFKYCWHIHTEYQKTPAGSWFVVVAYRRLPEGTQTYNFEPLRDPLVNPTNMATAAAEAAQRRIAMEELLLAKRESKR